jgi:hypothetical protein
MKGDAASIMVVESNDALRGVLARVLGADGFRVVALDPRSDPLPAAKPDAVVYEHWQAHGKSVATVEEWRRNWPGTRFIELSFYEEGPEPKADVVVELPAHLADLRDAIRREVSPDRRGVSRE